MASDVSLFALGFAGGAVCDFIPFHRLRSAGRESWPAYVNNPAYWIVAAASCGLAGAVAVLALSGASGNLALAAFLIGYAMASLIPDLARTMSPLEAGVDRAPVDAIPTEPAARRMSRPQRPDRRSVGSKVKVRLSWWTGDRVKTATGVLALIIAILTYLTK